MTSPCSLDHVGIYVEDLERSLGFYAEALGLSERYRFSFGGSRIAVLDLNGGLLEIIQRPDAPAEPSRRSHVALRIDDYGNLIARLEEMGLGLRKVALGDGSRIAFFEDPDGHGIEIMEKGLSSIAEVVGDAPLP
ncbi:hypothetical protein AC482_07010 [miscellaneous Crenarchaeota group-15 archaeon DG-45]|uniref:VOC domain-containing protein n=1 Tax=miscellaneous Crenarchaeota group-15 archaeon DG-45 TaxID=1685127 RepID=A0A0M0BKZ7_9ARCH|nr:MAG: hypothetical protein AC482_07010 [miscellaneous Crenarchaeota group-15 archaeon DG-45]